MAVQIYAATAATEMSEAKSRCLQCNKALKRMLPEINMNKINLIIDETSFISELQRKFYKTMLREQKERILDFLFQKLCKSERNKNVD